MLNEKIITVNGNDYVVTWNNGYSEPKYSMDLLSIPAVSTALEIKSNDVSQIPIYHYQKKETGRQRLNSKLDARLNKKPNKYTNAPKFWKTVSFQAAFDESFVNIKDEDNWWILPYGLTTRYTIKETREVRYAVIYSDDELKKMGQEPGKVIIKEDFAYDEVMHFYTFQDAEGKPISMKNKFSRVLGLASDTYNYMTKIYNRGGVVVGYLSTDKPMDEAKAKERIAWWKKLFGKNSNATSDEKHNDMRVGLLDNGLKFNRLDFTPQELMLFEQKKDLTVDISQCTLMPLWKLGVIENYHYASAEAATRDYIGSNLNPLLYQIEGEIMDKCIPDEFRNTEYVEYDREAIVTIDAKTMAEIDDMGLKNGSIKTNEWRARRNLSYVDGGDKRQIMSNVESDDYKLANEQLKLEKMRAEIELVKAQVAQTMASLQKPTEPPPEPPTVPAAPEDQPLSTDAPNGTPDAPTDGEMLASLRALQDECIASTQPDQLKDGVYLASMVASICGRIGAMHGVGDHLKPFAEKYAATANRRLADAQTINVGYEVNRAINAANHESMKLGLGITANAIWRGGSLDGQMKSLGETWKDNLRHPPIDDDCHCFLIPVIK